MFLFCNPKHISTFCGQNISANLKCFWVNGKNKVEVKKVIMNKKYLNSIKNIFNIFHDEIEITDN